MTTTTHQPPPPPPGPARHQVGLRDRVRLALWLWRLRMAMEDYPRREYREIRRDLRAAALEEAARVGMTATLRDLGRPGRLAAAYFAELDHPRPRWSDGALLGSILGLVLPVYMWLAWQAGALDAVAEMGGGVVKLSWLGSPVTLTHTDDALSTHFTITWQPVVVSLALFALTFALGARVWRLRAGA